MNRVQNKNSLSSDKKLVKTFCDLVKIPSPSGQELEVAKYIQKYLKNLGINSYSDNSGKIVHSNTGNVIAKLGKGKPKIMFVAHMDTVEDGKNIIKPVIKKGNISSDGSTILGADDKGGVGALLEAMKELRSEEDMPTILCVFSTMEEKGLMGVSCLDVDKSMEFVFDVDGSNSPGKFINKALGNRTFELHIYGKEAHAANNPYRGLNAIKTAGIIISKLKIGKDSKGGTLNIGSISGGRLTNVVPGYALLIGETRAFRNNEIDQNLNAVEKVAKYACKITGCKYKLVRRKGEVPLYTPSNKKIVALAKKAALAAGLKFSLLTISATIQGNTLASRGYNVLGLSKGGKFPHSKLERISVEELEQTKRLIIEIVKQYGAK